MRTQPIDLPDILLLAALVIALAFGAGALLGAPYLPLLKAEHENLLKLCDLKPGETLIDLGSGDGRFLKAAASHGYYAVGYEINPFLYIFSRIITWPERDKVTIHFGDYWHKTLPQASAIYVFLIDRFMMRLDEKLMAEITTPTYVVSYVFAIPNRKPEITTRNSFRYQYPVVAQAQRDII